MHDAHTHTHTHTHTHNKKQAHTTSAADNARELAHRSGAQVFASTAVCTNTRKAAPLTGVGALRGGKRVYRIAVRVTTMPDWLRDAITTVDVPPTRWAAETEQASAARPHEHEPQLPRDLLSSTEDPQKLKLLY